VVGTVIAYGENYPVRAGMVKAAGDFEWSSAAAHLGAAGYRYYAAAGGASRANVSR